MCFVGCIRDCREVGVEKDGIVTLMMMMMWRWELAGTWLIRALLFLIAVRELDNNQVFTMTSLNRLAMTGKRCCGDVCVCATVCYQTVAERAQGNCANERGLGKEAKTWLKWMRIGGRRFFLVMDFVWVSSLPAFSCAHRLVKLNSVPNCTRDVTSNYLKRRERVDIVRFPRNL
jgi:hypothetical protein